MTLYIIILSLLIATLPVAVFSLVLTSTEIGLSASLLIAIINTASSPSSVVYMVGTKLIDKTTKIV